MDHLDVKLRSQATTEQERLLDLAESDAKTLSAAGSIPRCVAQEERRGKLGMDSTEVLASRGVGHETTR